MKIVTEVEDVLEYVHDLMRAQGKSDDNDEDARVAILPRLDKESYQELSSVLRENSQRNSGHCGCEHDCCGCLVSSSYDIYRVEDDQTKLKVVYEATYNY